jgi:hypothetical protein
MIPKGAMSEKDAHRPDEYAAISFGIRASGKLADETACPTKISSACGLRRISENELVGRAVR